MQILKLALIIGFARNGFNKNISMQHENNKYVSVLENVYLFFKQIPNFFN